MLDWVRSELVFEAQYGVLVPVHSIVIRFVGRGQEDMAVEAPPTSQPKEHCPILPTAIMVDIPKHLSHNGDQDTS